MKLSHTRPGLGDLATYIRGQEEPVEGQVEIKLVTLALSRYFNLNRLVCLFYLRVHPMHLFPDPNSFIRG
jgi:hypothetical protein